MLSLFTERVPDAVQRELLRAVHRWSGTVPNETIPGQQRTSAYKRLRRCAAPGKRYLMNKQFFVYILANRPRGVLYIGVTSNLIGRITAHKAKAVPGFTKTHGIVMLVYFEEYSSILEARAREATLKRWRRAWKFELIDKFNPGWRDLTDELML